MNAASFPPALSVIVVSCRGGALLERCLTSLGTPTVPDAVEVIVAEPGEAPGRNTERLKHRFPGIAWACDPRAQTVPELRSLGIARSRGAIVALLEDDCVVGDAWCATVVTAHQTEFAAIGGAVEPGDYATALDWAMYFSEYGRFMLPLPKGPARDLPGTNVSYKRSVLQSLPDGAVSDPRQMGRGFYETFVHTALSRAGRRIATDPSLVVYNMNTWTAPEVLGARFHHGRGYAAMRVAGQPVGRRLPFLLVAAILPALQVVRTVREAVTRRRYLGQLGRALPWIVVLSISWATGEFLGYLLGPGGSLSRWR